MIFTGQSKLTIDPKGRLAIPAKHRAIVQPDWEGATESNEEGSGPSKARRESLFCVPWGSCLRLYTQQTFLILAQQQPATLAPTPEQEHASSSLFGLTERLELDSAGRIMLPREHVERAALSTDVYVVGAGHWLEVWDKDTWEREKEARYRNIKQTASQFRQVEPGKLTGDAGGNVRA